MLTFNFPMSISITGKGDFTGYRSSNRKEIEPTVQEAWIGRGKYTVYIGWTAVHAVHSVDYAFR